MTMLAVVIAILAVDLPMIFKRELCKTEEFGISLMDTGVALITLNSGMSSRKARPWTQARAWSDVAKELFESAVSVIFPIILGIFRILLLNSSDYQEHPSEWGIHWNFYTTVAAINILQALIKWPNYSIPFAFVLILSYQMVISSYSIEQFVFFAPRTTFFSANREGILSLVGYFAL